MSKTLLVENHGSPGISQFFDFPAACVEVSDLVPGHQLNNMKAGQFYYPRTLGKIRNRNYDFREIDKNVNDDDVGKERSLGFWVG